MFVVYASACELIVEHCSIAQTTLSSAIAQRFSRARIYGTVRRRLYGQPVYIEEVNIH